MPSFESVPKNSLAETEKSNKKRVTGEWRDKNREYTREYARSYYEEHKEQQISTAKRIYRERRQRVLEHYSGGIPTCACCGEQTIEFLVLDHINNDGSEHKRSQGGPVRSGAHIYHWIITNEFPAGFQVLCNNCNCAKAYYGECPHQKGPRR